MRKVIGRTISWLGFIAALVNPAASDALEQYQTEITAGYERLDFDGSPSRAIDATAGLEYFLAPVNTANHPYAEAAFLERIGSAGITATDSDFTSHSFKSDLRTYDLFVHYTAPDFPAVLTAGWSTASGDAKFDDYFFTFQSHYQSHTASDSYYLDLGTYLSYGLLASIGYRYDAGETTSTSFGTLMPVETSRSVSRGHEYTFSTKYVKETGSGTAFNLEAALEQDVFDTGPPSKKTTIVSFAGDFYFTRSVSVGAEIESDNAPFNYSDGKTYSARAKVFLTPRVSAAVRYDRFINDNPGLRNNRDFSIMLAARF